MRRGTLGTAVGNVEQRADIEQIQTGATEQHSRTMSGQAHYARAYSDDFPGPRLDVR